jgi:hypothetical protein
MSCPGSCRAHVLGLDGHDEHARLEALSYKRSDLSFAQLDCNAPQSGAAARDGDACEELLPNGSVVSCWGDPAVPASCGDAWRKTISFLAVLSMYPKAETPRLTLDKTAALRVGKRRASCPVCPNHTESIAGGADRSSKEVLRAIYSSGAIPISVRIEPQTFLRTVHLLTASWKRKSGLMGSGLSLCRLGQATGKILEETRRPPPELRQLPGARPRGYPSPCRRPAPTRRSP